MRLAVGILLICAAAALFLLTGCTSLRESAHTATAVDAATTAIGVGSGLAVEVNPLVNSPAAFAALMLSRVVGTEIADQMHEPARTETLAGLNAMWWGVSISNVLVLIAASNPVSMIAGAMVALGWWNSTAQQREFAAWCAQERLSNPGLLCVYTHPI